MIKKTISRMLSGSRQEKPSITQLKDEYFAQPTNLYDAASQSRHESRHKAINRSGANADTHTSESDYYYIAERARDLDRNNVVVGQAIDRLCANILQQGFEPEPDTGRKSLNELLKSKWAAYASDKEACDVQGEFDFNFLAYMALRESIVAGDTVVLPLKTGQLQMVESHRIRSPHTRGREAAGENVVHGVEMDSNRRRVRYWITKDDIPLNRLALMTEVSPFAVYDSDGNKQLFHVWHPTRSTMTRGITKLASSMTYIKMLDDVHFAKLVQQQNVSAYSLFRQRNEGFDLPDLVATDTTSELDPCDGSFRPIQKVSAGMMYTGFPGEELKVLSGNVPNPTFFDHSQQIEMLIGLNLDLPLILFRMDASETNFSGWRGAMEQAKLRFRHFQRWFGLCAFHRPIYLWKLRQWTNPASPLYDPQLAALREAVTDDRFFSHEWIFPGWPFIDPQAETLSEINQLGNSLVSPRRIQRSRGRNWTRTYEEIIEDKAAAIELAIKTSMRLNNRYPEDVNPHPLKWSDLIAFPRPAGENITDSRDLVENSEEETESSNGTSPVQ